MRLLALALLVVLAPAALAQPTPAADDADPVERLVAALALDDDQADLAAEILDGSAGATWTLAAELLPTLSDAQREALLAPPESAERPRRARGARNGQGRRAGGDRAQRQAERAARQAATRVVRDAALGLTDAQRTELHALDAERAGQGRRRLDAAARAEMRTEIEAVLSPDQMAIVDAQRALQRLTRRRGRR